MKLHDNIDSIMFAPCGISLHDAECSECHLKTRSSTSAAAGSQHEQ